MRQGVETGVARESLCAVYNLQERGWQAGGPAPSAKSCRMDHLHHHHVATPSVNHQRALRMTVGLIVYSNLLF